MNRSDLLQFTMSTSAASYWGDLIMANFPNYSSMRGLHLPFVFWLNFMRLSRNLEVIRFSRPSGQRPPRLSKNSHRSERIQPFGGKVPHAAQSLLLTEKPEHVSARRLSSHRILVLYHSHISIHYCNTLGVSKLWPMGQIQPTFCFLTVHELRMVFIF